MQFLNRTFHLDDIPMTSFDQIQRFFGLLTLDQNLSNARQLSIRENDAQSEISRNTKTFPENHFLAFRRAPRGSSGYQLWRTNRDDCLIRVQAHTYLLLVGEWWLSCIDRDAQWFPDCTVSSFREIVEWAQISEIPWCAFELDWCRVDLDFLVLLPFLSERKENSNVNLYWHSCVLFNFDETPTARVLIFSFLSSSISPSSTPRHDRDNAVIFVLLASAIGWSISIWIFWTSSTKVSTWSMVDRTALI